MTIAEKYYEKVKLFEQGKICCEEFADFCVYVVYRLIEDNEKPSDKW